MTENRFKNLALEALGCFVSALGVYSFAGLAAQVPIDGIAGVGAILYHLFGMPIGLSNILLNVPIVLYCFKLLGRGFFPAQRALHGDVRLLYRLCPAHAAGLHRRPPARRRLRRRGHGHWRRADLYAEFQHRRRRFHHNGHQGQAPAPAVRQPDFRRGAGRDPGQRRRFPRRRRHHLRPDPQFPGLHRHQPHDVRLQRLHAGHDRYRKRPAACEAIDREVDRGSTILKGYGGYKQDPRDVVLCACSSKQLYEIEKVIKRLDPGSFIIMLQANEIQGEGFRRLVLGKNEKKG